MKKSTLLFLAASLASTAVQAGGFSFAWSQENPRLIVHPIGYTGGTNEHLSIKVCIHSDVSAQQASEMEIPIKNAIAHWNALDPELENTVLSSPNVPSGKIDFESVFMHELGHCMGLAHPNLATESGLSNANDQRYAKALPGTNGSYNLDAGGDGVIGTSDDQRCDDENTNWFPVSSNDPFATLGTVIDDSTYSVEAGDPDTCNENGDLPVGHSFVEIAGLQVAQHYGLGSAEAVMHQGTRTQEAQRNINFDDAAMIRLAMSGADREQDTPDDYTYEIEFTEQQGTHGENCDITVNMTGSSFGLCRSSAFVDYPVTDHFVLAVNPDPEDPRPRIEFDPGIDWHFNSTSVGLIFWDRFED